MLKSDTDALALAREEFQPLCESWSFGDWEEINLNKFVKDLVSRQVLEERKKQAETAQDRKCLSCPKFLQHVSFERLLMAFLPLTDICSLPCSMTNGSSKRTLHSCAS